jgi:hypothetical protein
VIDKGKKAHDMRSMITAGTWLWRWPIVGRAKQLLHDARDTVAERKTTAVRPDAAKERREVRHWLARALHNRHRQRGYQSINHRRRDNQNAKTTKGRDASSGEKPGSTTNHSDNECTTACAR